MSQSECGDRQINSYQTMNREYPFIRATKPDKTQYKIDFEAIIDRHSEEVYICIGRLSSNDIVLSDPQKTISRHHCSIQYQNNRWWIIDENSSNGTFLQREINSPEIDVRSEDKIALRSGDNILILGKLDASRQPIFWQLEFIDPEETIQIFEMERVHSLEYSLSQQALFCNITRRREAIPLAGKERALIDYMSRQNYQNNGRVTVCKYDELISAVWNGDRFGIARQHVRRLIWQVRDKIELDSGEPKFLRTISGVGYSIDLQVIE